MNLFQKSLIFLIFPVLLLVFQIFSLNVLAQTTIPDTFQSDLREVKIQDLSQLQNGIPQGPSDPEIEVFLFADLTEEGFSGKVLTQNIPALLEAYPGKVRVWYIHTILPYRQGNLLGAIETIECLSAQNSFWTNIEKLINSDGRWDAGYQTKNNEKFVRCITDITTTPGFANNFVQASQERIRPYQGAGVPTAIFVDPQKPEVGIMVIGAIPASIYTEAMEKLLNNQTNAAEESNTQEEKSDSQEIVEKNIFQKIMNYIRNILKRLTI